jgi:sulfite exporter TauE/SafE
MELWSWIGAAALAGIVGTPHCLGMCGGFAVSAGDRPSEQGAYHLGKLTTYTVLGALAGLMGAWVPGPSWVVSLVAFALLLWFSAALLGWVPEPKLKLPGLTRLGIRAAKGRSWPSRLLLGVVNGLLPCGLLYASLGLAVGSGSVLGGALVMFTFGLATVPGLLAATFGVRRLLVRYRWTRVALALVIVGAGSWSLAQRHGVIRALTSTDAAQAAESPEEGPNCH